MIRNLPIRLYFYLSVVFTHGRYKSGKQTWHIELMGSLDANNDIILHLNLFNKVDMSITHLPGALGTILCQKNQQKEP